MQRPRGDNQERILAFIKKEINEKGYPPSVREIADAVGLKSTSTVHGHLQRLEKKGLLHRDAMKPRAMEVTGDPSFVRTAVTAVPVLGAVHPDVPLLAEENLEDYVPMPEVLLGQGGEHFILRVHGNAMQGDGILSGDYAVVRRQQQVEPGALAVVLAEELPVIGRVRRAADGTLSLVFAAESVPAVYPGAHGILGEVISLFRLIK